MKYYSRTYIQHVYYYAKYINYIFYDLEENLRLKGKNKINVFFFLKAIQQGFSLNFRRPSRGSWVDSRETNTTCPF